MDELKYILNIIPKPTPRPRFGKYSVYNKPEYTKYKNDLIFLIKNLNIKKGDYDYLHARFYFTYPKNTSKKKRINNFPLRTKCDCDNLAKGLMDALEYSGVINNDRQFSSVFFEKKYTTKENSYIEFDLEEVLISI